jgi:hypothetical protein
MTSTAQRMLDALNAAVAEAEAAAAATIDPTGGGWPEDSKVAIGARSHADGARAARDAAQAAMTAAMGRRRPVPDLIEIQSDHTGWSMMIDGEEFPWPVTGPGKQTEIGPMTRGPVTGPIARGQFPMMTVSLMARRIVVDHAIGPPRPD